MDSTESKKDHENFSQARLKLGVALIHYPVFDRAKNKVATNITNFDIHDIARVCQVYAVDHYYIVHPSREQLMFVSRVLDHWRVGPGQRFNPMRKTALDGVEIVESLEKAMEHFGNMDSRWTIATSAKDDHTTETNGDCANKGLFMEKKLQTPLLGFREARKQLDKKSLLLVFGTGFGLTSEVFQLCDFRLEPIRGYGSQDYRHLSVRSAVGICLDRLRGSW